MNRVFYFSSFYKSLLLSGGIFLFFISCEINDKVAPQEQTTFIKYLGSNLHQFGYDIISTSPNSMVLLGVAQNEDIDQNANRDIYVLVTDANGNVINDPNIESEIQSDESIDNDNHSPVMVPTKDGDGYYLAFERTVNSSSSALVITRLDNGFNKTWYVDTLMREGYRYTPNDIIAIDSGVLVFGTTTLSIQSGINMHAPVNPLFDEQVFLLKLDYSGELKWLYFYGTAGADRAVGIFENQDANSYDFAFNTINGLHFERSNIESNGEPGKGILIDDSKFDVIDIAKKDDFYYVLGNLLTESDFSILKILHSGFSYTPENTLAEGRVEISGDNLANSIYIHDEKIIIAGTLSNTNSNETFGETDYHLCQLSINGYVLEYEKNFGTTLEDQANKVIVNENNEIVLLGSMRLKNTTAMGLIKLDPNGNFKN